MRVSPYHAERELKYIFFPSALNITFGIPFNLEAYDMFLLLQFVGGDSFSLDIGFPAKW